MVNELGKLIYNALVKYHAVYLPDVGTIRVVRKAAMMSSKSELIPPHYDVEYSSNNSAKSLIDIISSWAGVDAKRAQEIYLRWLDKAREGSVVVIDRVGTIRDGSFVADERLIKALNICNQPLRITKSKSSLSPLVAIVVVLAISVAGVGGWWYFSSNTAVETIELVVDEVAVPLIEIPVIKEEQQFDVEPITDVEEETEFIVDWRIKDNIRHWVVVGSYSTTENVKRAIFDIEKRYPETQCDFFELGSMYAVAVFGSAEIDECQQFKRAHAEEFPQSWVYTPKRFR